MVMEASPDRYLPRNEFHEMCNPLRYPLQAPRDKSQANFKLPGLFHHLTLSRYSINIYSLNE